MEKKKFGRLGSLDDLIKSTTGKPQEAGTSSSSGPLPAVAVSPLRKESKTGGGINYRIGFLVSKETSDKLDSLWLLLRELSSKSSTLKGFSKSVIVTSLINNAYAEIIKNKEDLSKILEYLKV